MFYQRLHEICKSRGTTVTRMVKDLGLSTANLSNWKNGRIPKTEVAFKIANYLNVSVDYLMEQEQKNPPIPRDERIDDIYNIVKDLSETDMVALKAFAAGLKANRKSD